jgi:hypothetical protein
MEQKFEKMENGKRSALALGSHHYFHFDFYLPNRYDMEKYYQALNSLL